MKRIKIIIHVIYCHKTLILVQKFILEKDVIFHVLCDRVFVHTHVFNMHIYDPFAKTWQTYANFQCTSVINYRSEAGNGSKEPTSLHYCSLYCEYL